MKVLLAEDNAVNQRLTVRLLEKRGHTVAVAGNGLEALAALRKESFDLVFMDVQMPEMDGFEATAAIREEETKSGRHQQIIALTAHAMKGDRERCLAAGMDGYLRASRSGQRNWTKFSKSRSRGCGRRARWKLPSSGSELEHRWDIARIGDL